MDNNDLKELEKYRNQKKKQLNRQNKYITAKYDRLNFTVYKGNKETITNHYKKQGFTSLTQYITALITKDGCILESKEES